MARRTGWIIGSLGAAVGSALALPPDDPLYPLQWGYGPDGINVEGAWARGLDGSGVSIGIVDSGALAHEDLPPPVGGYDFISDPEVARDGDGWDPDPTDEGDWTFKYDSSWHGTHAAGIVQAVPGNGLGGVGIAPGTTVEHLRVAGGSDFEELPPQADLGDVASALVWAAGGQVQGVPTRAAPLDIVVISGPAVRESGSCGTELQQAVDFATAAGTIVIAAAHAFPRADAGGVAPGGCEGVITVGGVAPGNVHSPNSAFGDVIAVAAPSGGPSDAEQTQVLSAVDAGQQIAVGSSYGWKRGTGSAAAHVAGTVALMLQHDPSLTRQRIVGILRTTGYASSGFVEGCTTDDQRCGVRIDASQAVAVAAGDERMPLRVPPYPYPPSQPLVNGEPVLLPPIAEDRLYRLDVPSTARMLEFELVGLPGHSGRLYMYVRHGRAATAARNDCNTLPPPLGLERCVFESPAAGTWYVRVENASGTGRGFRLVARHYRRPGGLGTDGFDARQARRTRVWPASAS